VEFHDQPLSEAIGLLNRYTRAQIVIKDPKVAALRITGVFKTGDIERFGRSVSQVLPVRWSPATPIPMSWSRRR
jgi:transmembrane sensor